MHVRGYKERATSILRWSWLSKTRSTASTGHRDRPHRSCKRSRLTPKRYRDLQTDCRSYAYEPASIIRRLRLEWPYLKRGDSARLRATITSAVRAQRRWSSAAAACCPLTDVRDSSSTIRIVTSSLVRLFLQLWSAS
jgi:hypothetical protein